MPKKIKKKLIEKNKSLVFINSLSDEIIETFCKNNSNDDEILSAIMTIEISSKTAAEKINFLFSKFVPVFAKYLKLKRALERCLKENILLQGEITNLKKGKSN